MTSLKSYVGSMKIKNMASGSMMTACFVLTALFIVVRNLSIVSKIDVSHSNSRTHHTVPNLDVSDTETIETETPVSKGAPLPPPSEGSQISCDRSHPKYDICSIKGPTVLDPTTSTFTLVDPYFATSPPLLVEKIRPYPRKWENYVMKRIQEVTIMISGPSKSPKCEVQHDVPALVFSVGGYTGNFWHEFSDGFIPLFITVNSFYPDQDVVLVIDTAHDWWVSKYTELLQIFSKHPVIKLNNETTTHCFTSATIGLISHGFMIIDPTSLPNSKTFIHFRSLLDKAYSHGHRRRINPSKHNSPEATATATRPRLVLTSRRGGSGRVILNQAEAKRVAKEVGFEVIIFEPDPRTQLVESYELMNSSHAMIGVHGAALTHSLFLRPGSVFVQVVPLGLEWVAKVCFETSARAMELEYVEYKISEDESSLIEKYGKNDLVIKDPVAFRGEEWSDTAMNIYLKEQNVKLDLIRFRECLKKVFVKAKRFMENAGK